MHNALIVAIILLLINIAMQISIIVITINSLFISSVIAMTPMERGTGSATIRATSATTRSASACMRHGNMI